MKATYNKSQIMKEAHNLRRVLRYTMGKALSMAWSNAKSVAAANKERSERARIVAENAAYRANNTESVSLLHLSNSLTSYYANNMYNGD